MVRTAVVAARRAADATEGLDVRREGRGTLRLGDLLKPSVEEVILQEGRAADVVVREDWEGRSEAGGCKEAQEARMCTLPFQ